MRVFYFTILHYNSVFYFSLANFAWSQICEWRTRTNNGIPIANVRICIRLRVCSNVSEILTKINDDYERRKSLKIFVGAKSRACRPGFKDFYFLL